MNLLIVWCCLVGHDENIYWDKKDQRYLVWVCRRCEKKTKHLKMTHAQRKLFKSVKRVY